MSEGTTHADRIALFKTSSPTRDSVVIAICVLALAVALTSCDRRENDSDGPDVVAARHTCLYSGHQIDRLEAFGAALGSSIRCAMVFNNAAPTWNDLVTPWFTVQRNANLDWTSWKQAAPGRRLIISQALVPDDAPDDWRERGAAGEYEDEARRLATNLVDARLGDSVIRLAHEANGSWAKDGIGPERLRYGAWRDAWRRFAIAMNSVPGAAFTFDWTVNPGVEPVAFEDYYPGDDVVDIIGVDIYDYWEAERLGPAPDDPQERWDARFDEPLGAGELIAFARERGKPISLPEWALRPIGTKGGAGDNTSFIENIARLVRREPVEYHAYFEKSNEILLAESPDSFRVYRQEFGDRAGASSHDETPFAAMGDEGPVPTGGTTP